VDLCLLIQVGFNNGDLINRSNKKKIQYLSVGKVKLTPYLFALRKEHAVDNESRKLICLTYPSADQSKMNPHAEFQGYANPKENP
jgi:hypothetical protein